MMLVHSAVSIFEHASVVVGSGDGWVMLQLSHDVARHSRPAMRRFRGRVSDPSPPAVGPQPALKCYYRGDTVTRDGAMVLSVRAAQNETRKGFWAGTCPRHRTPVGILQRPSCPRRKQHQSTRSAECGNGGGRSSCRGSLLERAASRGKTKSSQVAMWSLGKSAMNERDQGHQSVARPNELLFFLNRASSET